MSEFADKFNREKQEVNALRGEKFKFVEGKNEMRILVEPVLFQEDFKLGICYTDCNFQGSSKYLAWVLDGKDGKLKQMKIPYSVMGDIVSLMVSDKGYAFKDFPMPYGVTINAVGAGTKEVKYTVIPDRENTETPAEIMEEVKSKKSPTEIIASWKKYNEGKHKGDGTWDRLHKKAGAEELDTIEYPTDELDPNDIPF